MYFLYSIFHSSWYELRFSNEKDDLIKKWNETERIEDDNLIEGSLTPQIAGTDMILILDSDFFNSTNTKYYMALKAYDSSNQSSELSNIAEFNNGKLPEFEEKEKGGISGGAIAGKLKVFS